MIKFWKVIEFLNKIETPDLLANGHGKFLGCYYNWKSSVFIPDPSYMIQQIWHCNGRVEENGTMTETPCRILLECLSCETFLWLEWKCNIWSICTHCAYNAMSKPQSYFCTSLNLIYKSLSFLHPSRFLFPLILAYILWISIS